MYKESEVNLDDIVKALLESELGFLLLQSDNNCKNMYDVLSEKSTYEDRIGMFGYNTHITYMDHSYQLSRPSIERIIDYYNDLLADEKLTVFEFGENCDLVLHIYKDEEFNPALDKDYSNIVTIHTAQDGKWIDDTEDVYVTDGSLYRELERINSYTDMGTL